MMLPQYKNGLYTNKLTIFDLQQQTTLSVVKSGRVYTVILVYTALFSHPFTTSINNLTQTKAIDSLHTGNISTVTAIA